MSEQERLTSALSEARRVDEQDRLDGAALRRAHEEFPGFDIQAEYTDGKWGVMVWNGLDAPDYIDGEGEDACLSEAVRLALVEVRYEIEDRR